MKQADLAAVSAVLTLVMSALGMAAGALAAPPASKHLPPAKDVAVDSLYTNAKVKHVDTSTGLHLFAYKSQLDVYVEVKNLGREPTGPLSIRLTLVEMSSDRTMYRRQRAASSIRSGKSTVAVFRGVPSNQGTTNRLTAAVTPIAQEADQQNNSMSMEYAMLRPK